MTSQFLVSIVLILTATPAWGADTDGDGLSDFQETHKYFTDSAKRDSDGDGIDDGDWHERREYTYTIRSIVKVIRPCNPAVINDDYQDARVLAETDDYVELEVIHYPFNTNADAIQGKMLAENRRPEMEQFLAAGVTTNWDEQLRKDLIGELKTKGVDIGGLTDSRIARTVASHLLSRGKYRYRFGTYFIDFSDGGARVLPGLERAFRREQGNTDLPFTKHLQCEVFGNGMFRNKTYGTCTSTATYLTTGLRAAGIPTRMVLAIPVIDGSDPAQVGMIGEHISHHKVKQTLLRGVPRSGFAAHTFNEVYVGDRWTRLNYSELGQNTYGNGAMGLLTHVHTFNDLSEAGLTKTWGWRYGRGERDDIFQHSNPYRTTELSDRFGIHSNIDNPVVQEPKVARISKAYWFFSDQRPQRIDQNAIQQNSDGHLLMHVSNVSFDDLKTLYPKLPNDFVLTAEGKPDIPARAERGHWSQECYLRIPAKEFSKMEVDVPYRLQPVNQSKAHRWAVDENVRITRRR